MKKIESIRELQLVELEILKDFHAFCIEKNIKYYFAGGTALGAIRHNGFIPWDDDIDIFIERPDYQKLLSLQSDKISERCTFVFPEKRSDYRGYIAKVQLTKSILKSNVYKEESQNVGISISLFVLDGITSNRLKRFVFLKKMYIYKAVYALCENNLEYANSSLARKIGPFIKPLFNHIDGLKVRNRILNYMNTYNFETCDFVCPTCDTNAQREIFNKNKFCIQEQTIFENNLFYVSKECIRYLETYYGNYMELPSKDQRKPKHSINAWLDEG